MTCIDVCQILFERYVLSLNVIYLQVSLRSYFAMVFPQPAIPFLFSSGKTYPPLSLFLNSSSLGNLWLLILSDYLNSLCIIYREYVLKIITFLVHYIWKVIFFCKTREEVQRTENTIHTEKWPRVRDGIESSLSIFPIF